MPAIFRFFSGRSRSTSTSTSTSVSRSASVVSTSTSVNQPSVSTSQFTSQQNRSPCSLNDLCVNTAGRSSLVQIQVRNQAAQNSESICLHRGCLKEWVCSQFLDGASPVQMRSPNGGTIRWCDVVTAVTEDEQFNYDLDEDTPAMRSMALAILAKNTTLRSMRKNHPRDFAKFSFDLARSIDDDDSIIVELNPVGQSHTETRINKGMLLEMAVEVALEQEQFSDLPRLCKKLNESSNKSNYVLSGIVVPRSTIAEWGLGRNLPLDREARSASRDQHSLELAEAVDNFMRQTTGDNRRWRRQENVMVSEIVQDTIHRFERIVSAYSGPTVTASNVFNHANFLMRDWKNSSSCDYNNRDKEYVTNGLTRLRAENTVVSSFGSVSQAQVLARLCSYIESPSHSPEKKENILGCFAHLLRDIGRHRIECPHGQIGAIMSVPQGIDEQDPSVSRSGLVDVERLRVQYQNQALLMLELEKPSIENNVQGGADEELLSEILRAVIKAKAYHNDVVWCSSLIDDETFNRAFDRVFPPGLKITECV